MERRILSCLGIGTYRRYVGIKMDRLYFPPDLLILIEDKQGGNRPTI